MPKQVATSERSARTIRSDPQLMAAVDAIAVSDGATFNDTANTFLEFGVALSALDPETREIVLDAAVIAAQLLSVSKAPKRGNPHVLNAERLLRAAVREACRGRLKSPQPFSSSELWAAASEIVEELELTGSPWNLITDMRIDGAPLSDADAKSLNAALAAKLKSKSLSAHEKGRIEMLGVYADHAYHQHVEDWEEFQRSVRDDLDAALGVKNTVRSE